MRYDNNDDDDDDSDTGLIADSDTKNELNSNA